MLDSSTALATSNADFSPLAPGAATVAPGAATVAPGAATATDRDLGQALIDSHPDALPAAWRRYHPMIRRMLRRALGADSDIEDAVQDVFLGLFQRAHALRNAEAVRPFVIGIARHTLHRERRRKRLRHQLALEYVPQAAQVPSVGSGAAARYALIKLNGLLQRLTEQERAAFVLREGHGMTVPEVAEALRVSEPTAKRRLSRARECLGNWAANDPFLLGYVQGKKVG